MKTIIALLALVGSIAGAQTLDPLTEIRYCGPPQRTASGEIKRSTSVLAAFKRAHPCPSTGLTSGACPGWYMDHVVPLACGGCDAVWNLQWLDEQTWRAKSRFERGIYEASPPIADTDACNLQVM